jgi:hypothetical protein
MEEYIFNSEFFCLIFFSVRSFQNTQGPIGPGQWKIGLNEQYCPETEIWRKQNQMKAFYKIN